MATHEKVVRLFRRQSVALALFLGLVLRLAYARWAYCSTFDTATVGLMAVNILTKGERPLFFYGQDYFGSLEAWLAAALFRVFGVSEEILTLAAILPALAWIGLTALLFREWLNRAAGAAAAWTLAIPSAVVLHYSVGTYGGYPIAYALGTLCLWLSLRIWQRNISDKILWVYAPCLGLSAGLAIWTHPISAAYLLPAALLLLAHMARHRFAARVVAPFIAAAPLFLLGVLPVVFGRAEVVPHGTVHVWRPSPRRVAANLIGLFRRPLREHMQWSPRRIEPACVLLLLSALACLITLKDERAAQKRRRLLLPFAALGLFLLLYLPHGMAALRVSRYVIPFWTILIAALVSIPFSAQRPVLRRAGAVLATLWIAHYALGGIWAIRERKPRREREMAARESLVAAARAANVRSAMIVGSELDGYWGQIYSFTARGEIAFVSPYRERHNPSAQAAERDPGLGFVVAKSAAPLVVNALKDLQATWQVAAGTDHALFFEVRTEPLTGQVIQRHRVQVREPAFAPPDALSDRDGLTTVSGAFGEALTLEIDEPAELIGLYLASADATGESLPRDFRIRVSLDGNTYQEVRGSAPRVAAVWSAGPRVWMKGYGVALECRFAKTPARFVKLEMLSGPQRATSPQPWSLAEVYLIEACAEAMPTNTVDALASALEERGVTFVFADRTLSAELNERALRGGSVCAPPRRNPQYRATLWDRRIWARPDCAIAVARPWAKEAGELIQENWPGVPVERVDFGGYSVFVFGGAGPSTPLIWQGCFLWRSAASQEADVAAGSGRPDLNR